MSAFETFLGWFRGRPSLPTPPALPGNRIYLTDDDLNWDSIDAINAALRGKAEVKNYRIDLRGQVLDGSRITRGKDRQDEGALGIRLRVNGVTLTNGFINDIPGGVKVFGSQCRFTGLKFLKAGEDFLSTVGRDATGIRIADCEFWNDRIGDKSVQLNQALGAYLKNLLIVGGITGLRVQKVDYRTPQVTVMGENVRFVGCECGLNVDGGATVRLSGGKFEGVKKKWVSGDKVGGKVVLL